MINISCITLRPKFNLLYESDELALPMDLCISHFHISGLVNIHWQKTVGRKKTSFHSPKMQINIKKKFAVKHTCKIPLVDILCHPN